MKDSAATSKKAPYFPTFQCTKRYPSENPTQPTPDPSYTSSPDNPDSHQDSSSNEEI